MSLSIGAHTQASQVSGAGPLVSSGITTNQGSGLIVGLGIGTSTFRSLVDNFGNVGLLQVGSEIFTGAQRTRLFYFPVLSGAGPGHTFTATLAGTGLITMFVQEITTSGYGIKLDQQAGGHDAASPFGNALGITTLIDPELLISIGYWQAGTSTDPDTWTAGGSFASGDMNENQTTASNKISGAMCSKLVTLKNTYNASWTSTKATSVDMHMASFSEVPFVSSTKGRMPYIQRRS